MRTPPFAAAAGALFAVAHPIAAAPPPVPASARDAAGFAPAGWRVLESAAGDLNRDGVPDLAVALGSAKEETDDPASVIDSLPPRLLVVAWGQKGGGAFRRAVVDEGAVLGRFDGGVFGDPLAALTVERGALVVSHYGGSRGRWAYTDRYRWQNGAFELIGATHSSTDTLSPEYERTSDLNLSTGLVEERQRGRLPDVPGGPFRSTHYELRTPTLPALPALSDAPLARPAVRLRAREDVARGAKDWRGEADLAATVSAAMHGESLYLRAIVRDDRVLAGDTVQWVDAEGRAVKPAEVTLQPFPGGYRWQGRYTAASLGLAKGSAVGTRGRQPAWGAVIRDAQEEGLVDPLLRASIEVVDFDAPGVAKSALSTARSAGRKRPATVRLLTRPGVPRLGDGSAAPGAAAMGRE